MQKYKKNQLREKGKTHNTATKKEAGGRYYFFFHVKVEMFDYKYVIHICICRCISFEPDCLIWKKNNYLLRHGENFQKYVSIPLKSLGCLPYAPSLPTDPYAILLQTEELPLQQGRITIILRHKNNYFIVTFLFSQLTYYHFISGFTMLLLF